MRIDVSACRLAGFADTALSRIFLPWRRFSHFAARTSILAGIPFADAFFRYNVGFNLRHGDHGTPVPQRALDPQPERR